MVLVISRAKKREDKGQRAGRDGVLLHLAKCIIGHVIRLILLCYLRSCRRAPSMLAGLLGRNVMYFNLILLSLFFSSKYFFRINLIPSVLSVLYLVLATLFISVAFQAIPNLRGLS